MHDAQLAPESVTISTAAGDTPSAMAVTMRTLAAAINTRTAVRPGLSAIAGDVVDIINDLTTGRLVRRIDGLAPGPQVRAYGLTAFPDFGDGALSLPALDSGGRGTLTPVDDNGNTASGSAVTGVTFTSSAYLKSVDTLAPSLDPSTGWVLRLRFRTPSGVSNSSKTWVAIGRRTGSGNYGISVTETSGGGLIATIEDPDYPSVSVRSAGTPRSAIVDAALIWNPGTMLAQWVVNGSSSGAAVPVPFVPELAGGSLILGTSLAETTSSTPRGSLHGVGFEVTNIGVTESFVPVGPVTTLSVADANLLMVETIDILEPVAAAGSISIRFQTASGEAGEDINVAIGGYANVVQTLTRYLSAETPYVAIDIGSASPGVSTLVVTPPALGKFDSSSEYKGVGSTVRTSSTGVPPRTYVTIDPQNDGSTATQNPAGPIPRGHTDLFRLEQEGATHEVALIEMNRAPRLNGGGEAWGHADDRWVPIHALWYGYSNGDYRFPTIDGEAPTVTVTAVPGPGEGAIRVNRTGPDLRVGDVVSSINVRRLGWWKAGVSSITPGCRLGLRVSAPGAPDGQEEYALRMTDAPRPTAFSHWSLATYEFADSYTQIRWASRGGDWTGQDGLWGASPYVQTPSITAAQTVTIDVTAMVKSFGPEFFISAASTKGSVGITPPAFTPNPANEPILRVTGGARAGIYKASRWGQLSESTTSWRLTNSSNFSIKRTQPLLLAFDMAGAAAALGDATRIELVLAATGSSSGGSALQLFRPTPQPPRPSARIAVDPTPARSRADLLTAIDTDAGWTAMTTSADDRNRSGSGQPDNFTIANGCYYGAIPTGKNPGMSLLHGFWKPDRTGYPLIRMARMVGWHTNYQPGDDKLSGDGPGFSGKSPGPIASGDANLSGIEVGRGGNPATGLGGYSCRSQRGAPAPINHPSSSPLHGYLTFGDYNYFLSGLTNGGTTNAIAPVPRMKWLWIETVHGANTVHPDGTWSNDGVFELYVNGRKHCSTHRLEYLVAGGSALWDAIWFDEYNGGTEENRVDRPWPFVVGPTYVVAGSAPIAPPADWNVPFVTADGTPDTAPLAYQPDYA